jgi:tRNA(fMet)-specific endonuclease VapC
MARVRYLLDTNVLSEPVVARPSPAVMTRLEASRGFVAIASVTWQEVLFGLFLLPAGRRRQQVEDYLFRRVRPALPILGFDEPAARWQAEQRARLRQAGRPPSYPDSQIAAIAAVNELVLVTRNIEDFEGFQGLTVENWFDEQVHGAADQ